MTRRADSLLTCVSSDVPATLDSLEDSIRDMEAENEARMELLVSSRSVEEEMVESRKNEEIEEELARLREKVKAGD